MAALPTWRLDDRNRAFGFGVLASVALHAILFLALPLLREAQTPRSGMREPLLARVLQPPVKQPVPPVPVPEPVRPTASIAEEKPRARTRQSSQPVPAATSRPVSAEPAPATTAVAAAPQSASVAEPSPAVTSPMASTVAPPVPPAAESPDAGTLAQYRLAVISAARRFKRYPRVALDNNWQGKVEIRMAISASGSISALSLRTSTGHAILDEQALEMIERAKAMAQIPPALRGREFNLDIPIIFSLRDAD